MQTDFRACGKKRGFAISLDALFALILLVMVIGVIGAGTLDIGEQVPSTKVSTLGQNLEDALTSFENTGFLTQQLNPTLDQEKTNEIYLEIKKLLPENTEVNLKITKYDTKTDSAEMRNCREQKTFSGCFDLSQTFEPFEDVCPPTCQPEIPETGDVLAGRKIVMQRQAGSQVGGQDKCLLSPKGGQLKGTAAKWLESVLNLQEEEEPPTITLNTTITDNQAPPQAYGASNPLNCYDSDAPQDNQIANVNISAVSNSRDAVSIMLVSDVSQSMAAFDMTIGTKTGTASPGTYSGNCPSGTNLQGTSTASEIQTADTFAIGAGTVQNNFRGIYAKVTGINVASDAACSAGFGFINPLEPFNNNFYFSYNPGTANGDFCAQRIYSGEAVAGTQCTQGNYGDRQAYSPLPLPSGNYNILAWSDKQLSYTIDWSAERIDVAKNAAKFFLDAVAAPGMAKPGDLFGLVSFQGSAAGKVLQKMTNNTTCVKSMLNTLTPFGGTPLATAIETASNGITDKCCGTTCENCSNCPANTNQRFIIYLVDSAADSPQSGSTKDWTTFDGTRVVCKNNCNEEDPEDCCRAMAAAIDKANLARTEDNTTIFVIGIANEAVFNTRKLTLNPADNPNYPDGILYSQAFKDMAKDSDLYSNSCFDAVGNIIPSAHCGKFYYASDAGALQEVYNLVMQQISKLSQTVNIQTNLPSGTEILCNSTCNPTTAGMYCAYSDADSSITCTDRASCTPETDCDGGENSWQKVDKIIYSAQTISAVTWSGSFKARIPCDMDETACQSDSVTFPAAGSEIITSTPEEIPWEPDTVNTPPETVCQQCDDSCRLPPLNQCDPNCEIPGQSCNISVPFLYKDLKIVFTEGTITPPTGVSLTMKIGNKGYKDISLSQAKPLRISFHAGTAGGERLNVAYKGVVSGGFTLELSPNPNQPEINDLRLYGGTISKSGSLPPLLTSVEIRDIAINATGDIFAVIAEDDVVKQCRKDDTDYISCSKPETYYYVIDYSGWSKT